MPDFNSLNRIHLIGIGGISMSSIALLLLKKGKTVTGCDRAFSQRLLDLSEQGCTVCVGTDLSLIEQADLTVYTSALKYDSEELTYCRAHNLPCMERHEFLGIISKLFLRVIAVSGTHGKTTATAMLTKLMADCNMNFCGHIGGDAIDIGNFYYSGDEYFVTEACEYRRSLLSLSPYIAVVLNVESDHPDTYKNLDALYDTFDSFVANANLAVINGDTEYYKKRQSFNKSAITFGLEKHNQYTLENIHILQSSIYGYDLCRFGIPVCQVKLNIEGYHNIYNSAAAIVSMQLLGIDCQCLCQSMAEFKGVKRRFEKLGLCEGALIVSDYAHHPTEISATIHTAKKKLAQGAKLYAVFQPHTYSRTYCLFAEFLKCFDACDELIILKEYQARETPDMGISARMLFDNIEHQHKRYCDSVLDIAAYLIERINPDDIVLIMGAGDVDNLGSILVDCD